MSDALAVLLIVSACGLALTGDHFFGTIPGRPSLWSIYALDSGIVLGWLAYFGWRG